MGMTLKEIVMIFGVSWGESWRIPGGIGIKCIYIARIRVTDLLIQVGKTFSLLFTRIGSTAYGLLQESDYSYLYS